MLFEDLQATVMMGSQIRGVTFLRTRLLGSSLSSNNVRICNLGQEKWIDNVPGNICSIEYSQATGVLVTCHTQVALKVVQPCVAHIGPVEETA